MGRERPRPRLATAAPRPFSGSLTPHMSVLMMCWGARLMVAEICAVISLPFPGNSDLKSA
jgi:hypothetical protein